MPSRLVKQPNGNYARFSTVVDNFTDLDMTRDEAYEMCKEEWGEEIARTKVASADADLGALPTFPEPRRWNEALAIIRAIHGEAAVEELQKMLVGRVQ